MTSNNNTSQWEDPKFSFNLPNQAEDWKEFYIRAIDYLEALYIDVETLNEFRRGWKQVKIMFHGEDGKASQTLVDSNTITRDATNTRSTFKHHKKQSKMRSILALQGQISI